MWSQRFPPPGAPPPVAPPGNAPPPNASPFDGPPPGGFRPPPPPQQGYHNGDGHDESDDDDGALGATINLVTSAASMFFKAASAPPPRPSPQHQPTPPTNRGPPPPIEPPSSMLEFEESSNQPSTAFFSAPTAQPFTPATGRMQPVPASPLASSSPRVSIPQRSPIISAAVPQIAVPSLGVMPPANKPSPAPTIPPMAQSLPPSIPPLPSSVSSVGDSGTRLNSSTAAMAEAQFGTAAPDVPNPSIPAPQYNQIVDAPLGKEPTDVVPSGKPPLLRATPPPSPKVSSFQVPPSPKTPLRSNSQSSLNNTITSSQSTSTARKEFSTPTPKLSLPTPSTRRHLPVPQSRASASPRATPGRTKFKLPPPRKTRISNLPKASTVTLPSSTPVRVEQQQQQQQKSDPPKESIETEKPSITPTPEVSKDTNSPPELKRPNETSPQSQQLTPEPTTTEDVPTPFDTNAAVTVHTNTDPIEENPSAPSANTPPTEVHTVNSGTLPEDWVETVDPSNGQSYFYNVTTQETSWERPVAPINDTKETTKDCVPPDSLEPETTLPEEAATTTIEQNDVDEPPTESAAAPAMDTSDTPLPMYWVETTDPTSGRVYFYNTLTQETSWDRPKLTEPPSTLELLREQQQQKQTDESVDDIFAALNEEFGVTEETDGTITNLDPPKGDPEMEHAKVDDAMTKEDAEPETVAPDDQEPETSAPDNGNIALPEGWVEAIDPTTGQQYYYNTITQATSWERPEVNGEEPLSQPTEQVDEDSHPELAQAETTTDKLSDDPLAAGSGIDISQPHDSALPEHWEEIVDQDSGRVYYYNTSTEETSWDRPQNVGYPSPKENVQNQEASNVFSLANDDEVNIDEKENGTTDNDDVVQPNFEIEQKDSDVKEGTNPGIENSEPAHLSNGNLADGWIEVVDPTSGQVYYYNEETQETSWNRPVVQSEFDPPHAETDEVHGVSGEDEDPGTIDAAREDMEPVEEAQLSDMHETKGNPVEQAEGELDSEWVEAVDPSSGREYFYNIVTQETSWDRPMATEVPSDAFEQTMMAENQDEAIDTGISSLPAGSNVDKEDNEEPVIDQVLSEEVGANVESEQELLPNADGGSDEPESGVMASDKLVDGWIEVVDPTSGQVYYYNEDTQETSWDRPLAESEVAPTKELSSDSGVEVDGVEAVGFAVENAMPEDTLPGGIDDKDTGNDSESNVVEATADWVEAVDPTSGQVYFYNTVTQETSWDRPVGMKELSSQGVEETLEREQHAESEDLDTPTLPIESTGNEDMAEFTSGESGEMTVSEENEYVEGPASDEVLDGGAPAELSEPEMVPSDDLAEGWVEASDPTSGQLYYYNTVTQETSWDRPVDQSATEHSSDFGTYQENAPFHGESEGALPLDPNTEKVDTVGDALSSLVDDEKKGQAVESNNDEFVEEWIEAIDQSSGRAYFYNTVTQETSWDRPSGAGLPTSTGGQKSPQVEKHALISEEVDEQALEVTEVVATDEGEPDANAPCSEPDRVINSESVDKKEEYELKTTPRDDLPDGWVELVDSSTGKVYYYNSTTQEASWDRPEAQVATLNLSLGEAGEQLATTGEEEHSGSIHAANEEMEPLDEVQSSAIEGDNTTNDRVEQEDEALGNEWIEAIDPASGQAYFYNTVTHETRWDRPKAMQTSSSSEMLQLLSEQQKAVLDTDNSSLPSESKLDRELKETPTIVQIISDEKRVDIEPDPQETDGVNNEPDSRGSMAGDYLVDGWIEVVDPTSGQVYYYNEETQETSWDRPMVQSEFDPPYAETDEVHGVLGEDEDPGTIDAAREDMEPVEEAQSSDMHETKGNPVEQAEGELDSEWVEAVDPSSGRVYFYNMVTQETSWDRPMATEVPSDAFEQTMMAENQDEAIDTGISSLPAGSNVDKEENEEPVIDQVLSEEVGANVESEQELLPNADGGSDEPESGVMTSDKLVDGWIEVVDPTSGQVYYYNEDTQETSWDRPLAESEVAPTKELSSDSGVEVDGVEAVGFAVENAMPEDTLPGGIDDKDTGNDSESNVEEATADWVEAVDPTSGQVYFYNAVTQETSWDRPVGMKELSSQGVEETLEREQHAESEDLDTPTLPIESTGNEDMAEFTSGESGEMTVSEENEYVEGPASDEVLDGGAPAELSEPEMVPSDDLAEGWVEASDPTSGQLYYYNTVTQETSWDRPVQSHEISSPRFPSNKGENAEGTHPETENFSLGAHEPPQQSPPLPHVMSNWVESVDESSGKVYFYNTVTQETSWEPPEETLLRAESKPEDSVGAQSILTMNKERGIDSAPEVTSCEYEDERTDPDRSLRTDISVLPVNWEEVKDPTSGSSYFYNSETKETSWERPTLPLSRSSFETRIRSSASKPTNGSSNHHLEAEEKSEGNEGEVEDSNPVLNVAESAQYEWSSDADDSPENTIQGEADESERGSSGDAEKNEISLPNCWEKVVDPVTGNEYYYNTVTQETCWELPPEHTVARQGSDDSPEQEIDEDGSALPASEEAVESPMVEENAQSHLNNEWVDVTESATIRNNDSSSGKQAALSDKELNSVPRENSSDDKALEPQLGIGDESEPEWTDGSQFDTQKVSAETESFLPQDWIEAQDPGTGQTYFYHSLTGETSWERPTNDKDALDGSAGNNEGALSSVANDTVLEKGYPIEKNATERSDDEFDIVQKTELADGGGSALPEPSDPSHYTLPEFWTHAVDPNSGRIYFFNTLTQETSWKPPEGSKLNEEPSPVDEQIPTAASDIDSGMNSKSDMKERILTESGHVGTFDKSGKASVAIPGEPTIQSAPLSDGWVQVVDPSNSQAHSSHEESKATAVDRSSPTFEGKVMSNEPEASFLFELLADNEKAEVLGALGTEHQLAIAKLDDERVSHCVTGPLISMQDAIVSRYVRDKAKVSNDDMLWRLIVIAADAKGRLRSDDGILNERSPESAIVKLLLDDDVHDPPAAPTGSFVIKDGRDSSTETSAERVQELLLQGKRREAVEEAISGGDYATALLVGTMCDVETYKRATTAFAANAFASGSPMHTVAMLFSGGLQAPATSDEGSYHWGVNASELRQSWRKHLAGIISNRVAGWDSIVLSLGDRLRQIGEIPGAHFCYIVCGCPVSSPTKEGTRLALLGCEHTSLLQRGLISGESIEAFSRTEAYEWAKRQGNKKAILKSLSPFKLIFAAHLADSGLIEKAVKYVTSFRKGEISNQENASLASLFDDTGCLHLAQEKIAKKLNCADELALEKFESNESQGWHETSRENRMNGDTPYAQPQIAMTLPNSAPPSIREISDNETFRLDKSIGVDATFVSAKSNLMDVTGYTLDSPTKFETKPTTSDSSPILGPAATVEQNMPTPLNLSGPIMKSKLERKADETRNSDATPLKQDLLKDETLGVAKQQPVLSATPQATAKPGKPKAAPSTAPSVMMGGKAARTARASAPSSSEKKGGWSLRQRFVKWINPDATEVTLPDSEEKPYYDEKRKVWVFPGDNPDDLVKPIAPPPLTVQPAAVQSEPETPTDPLAAMMAPPRRGPSTGRRPAGALPGTLPGIPTGFSAKQTPGGNGAPPPFAVFRPSPAAGKKANETKDTTEVPTDPAS